MVLIQGLGVNSASLELLFFTILVICVVRLATIFGWGCVCLVFGLIVSVVGIPTVYYASNIGNVSVFSKDEVGTNASTLDGDATTAAEDIAPLECVALESNAPKAADLRSSLSESSQCLVESSSVSSSDTIRSVNAEEEIKTRLENDSESDSDIGIEQEDNEPVVALNLSESNDELRGPIPASNVDDTFFPNFGDTDFDGALAREFNAFASSTRLLASSTRVSQTNGEFRSYSHNADLIGSAIGSNEEKSFLEQFNEELYRVSSSVKSSVLPIEVKYSPNSSEKACSLLVSYNDKFWAVTNFHTVAEAVKKAASDKPKLYVGNTENTNSIRVCEVFDVAVIELDTETVSKNSLLTCCKFGNSSVLKEAELVIACGCPFGLRDSIASGLVSALQRSKGEIISSKDQIPEFIQFDAAINPGNSGGPLCNCRGEVVGMVTAIVAPPDIDDKGVNIIKPSNVSFAIPSNYLLRIVKTLADEGTWKRSLIDVGVHSAEKSDLAATKILDVFGVKVAWVTANGPGDQAGLRKDDVILAYNGGKIRDCDHFVRLISLNGPQKARLSVVRGDQFFETEVTPEVVATMGASLPQGPAKR